MQPRYAVVSKEQSITMNQLIQSLITISTTAITISCLSLSAQAQQSWIGRGQIIDGDNEGALVELEVIVNSSGEKVTIQSDPSPGEEIPLQSRTETKIGFWTIYPCDNDLCATLEQEKPTRTIYYRLSPN